MTETSTQPAAAGAESSLSEVPRQEQRGVTVIPAQVVAQIAAQAAYESANVGSNAGGCSGSGHVEISIRAPRQSAIFTVRLQSCTWISA